MTRWLQAAIQKTEGAGQQGNRPCTPDDMAKGVLSVKSVLSEGEAFAPAPPVASIRTFPSAHPEALRPARAEAPADDAAGLPYGTANNLGHYPRTWNGRVVSLAVWRELTDWERHGPRAQHWNGKTGQWENPSDDCHRPPTSPRGGSDLCG